MDLTSIQTIVEAIRDPIPQEASIAIADQSRFIFYQPSKSIDLRIKPGDEIQEGTLTRLALRKRVRLSKFVDSSPFGIDYYATSTPITNGDMTIGCFTLIYPSYPESYLPRYQFLIGKADGRWVPVPFSDIYLITSETGKTFLYTTGGKYLNKYSLVELERMLPPEQFIRCHRSFLVNVNEIAEIHPDFHSTFVLVLKKNRNLRVSVSQKYASRFRHLMGF
ncbi:LytTR family DNA-binding domain-containing protein [Effusibacillus dendaii]|uniref:LytR family transcriptional regulator n=1 Tax=Effusibacillus dendaii TaxID=2743772 RepID=A0A7I8D7B2_9BACL|nr:LytTR family DNA-binding domain-containing protein [Effusibacillus dendaii]BCJ85955.1 LytR family transcriptional regulator [Effusibacillus dendaii]